MSWVTLLSVFTSPPPPSWHCCWRLLQSPPFFFRLSGFLVLVAFSQRDSQPQETTFTWQGHPRRETPRRFLSDNEPLTEGNYLPSLSLPTSNLLVCVFSLFHSVSWNEFYKVKKFTAWQRTAKIVLQLKKRLDSFPPLF